MSRPSEDTPPTNPDPPTGALSEEAMGWLRNSFRRRWQAGDRVRVEEFLGERFASPFNEEAVVELAYEEVALREELGERPEVEEYVQRFPDQAEALRSLLSAHLLFSSHPELVEDFVAQNDPQSRGATPTTAGGRSEALTLPYPPHQLLPPSVRVPGYRVEGELGRGGMGIVYDAWQVALKRRVALKVILASRDQSAILRERFRRETEAVARLQHANVVQIHEVGEYLGIAYYSMEFCPGGSLAGQLAATPQSPRWSAEVIATLARAMHYMHEKGVVHRDLKPANVLLAEDGTVKIGDFGLARQLGDAGLTASWEVLGTPCYMAPEQAWGQHTVGPAVDVYALGAILYECLTGRPPFKAATPMETIHQVAHVDPVPARRLLPDLPADVDTICMRCLHKDPIRRYPTALALAEDLERFLAGQPIQARPVSRVERAAKWARRQPLVTALIAAVALITFAGVVAVGLAWRRAEAARQKAQDEAAERDRAYRLEATQRHRAEQQLYFSRIALADRELRAGKPAWAVSSLDLCPEELRDWEWHCLSGLARGKKAADWQAHDRPISCLAFDPQSKVLASAGLDGLVRLWQVGSGKPAGELKNHEAGVNWVRFSPDDKRLASAGSDGTVIVWQDQRQWKRLPPQEHAVSAVAFHPNGRLLATATFDVDAPGIVRLWDVERGAEVHRYTGHTSRITALAYTTDGSLLASASHDGTVRLLAGDNTAEEKLVFREHAFPVSAVAFSPDGHLVASAAGRLQAKRPEEGEVLLWRAATGEVVHRLKGHVRRPTTVAFNPSGTRLATSGWDGEVMLWDVASGQEVLSLPAGGGAVMHVAFSPDGRWLAAGGVDQRMRLWDGGR
jgi:WD40 repeat protein/tRNA A-37 threonylcarbamoyl transferase component Bud32